MLAGDLYDRRTSGVCELAREMKIFFCGGVAEYYLCFQVWPSALVQCSPSEVVISKTAGNGLSADNVSNSLVLDGISASATGLAWTETDSVAEPMLRVKFASSGSDVATLMVDTASLKP